jgi:hypothetical protein
VVDAAEIRESVNFGGARTEKPVSGSTPLEMRNEMLLKPDDHKLKEKYLNKISLYLRIDSKFGKLGLKKESGLGLKISNLYKTIQELALKDKNLTIYQEEVARKSQQSKGQQGGGMMNQQMGNPSQQMGNAPSIEMRVDTEKLLNLRKAHAVGLSALDVLTNEEIRDFHSRIDKHDTEMIPNLNKLKTQIHSDLEKAGIINKQCQILGKTN